MNNKGKDPHPSRLISTAVLMKCECWQAKALWRSLIGQELGQRERERDIYIARERGRSKLSLVRADVRRREREASGQMWKTLALALSRDGLKNIYAYD